MSYNNDVQSEATESRITCNNCESKCVRVVDGSKVGDKIDEVYRCDSCGSYTRIIQTEASGIIHKSTTNYTEGDIQ